MDVTLVETMTIGANLRNTLRRYRKDDGGNISMIFGSIFIILIACIGAGYDMNQLTSTKAKASSIADTSALTAAIYYSTNNRKPTNTSEGFVHGQEYDASSFQYKFDGLSTKQSQDVKIKVLYDLDKKEVTARVYGHTKVAFMQVFGHNKLEFQSEATAKFSEVELKDPASIMLVLDNSGSMWFDDKPNDPNSGLNPPEAQRRITALKNSVNTLMAQLDGIAGPQTKAGERFLRTGMKTYSSELLNTTVPMDWGTLTTGEVGRMVPGGGTNSSPPMQAAAVDLTQEDEAHKNDKFGTKYFPGDEPIKFLIFMTDGQNNNDSRLNQWEAVDGTELWRKLVEPAHMKRYCRYYYRGRCRAYGRRWVPDRYDYEDGEESPPGAGWEEGLVTGNLDRLTRQTCEAMRDDNVRVYSIGFALESGTFDTNEWGQDPRNPRTYPISSDVKRAAMHMMKSCSGADHPERFLLAKDAASLEEAFETIGLDIVKEIIRLSM